jgi:hypothetical protein
MAFGHARLVDEQAEKEHALIMMVDPSRKDVRDEAGQANSPRMIRVGL